MTINLKNLCIALIFSILAPFQLAADEVTNVVNDIAAKLVSQLPMDKKIALKSLSPDETGLPEDFLRKLTSDLEAALLTASDFEINLANRATMEDVWQEAVEFNNADFDELFKSANADVMLMMSPRAIATGVEIAITAYSLTGDSVGKTLASSGSVLLPIDLQANLGVDVNDLNQQMSQVLAEIEKVGQTGGLISNPNTYAEFYHNARILQQRGEVDLAMRNYEQALAEGYLFVDPLIDLLALARSRYGDAGVTNYFAKKISPTIPSELNNIGLLLAGTDPLTWVEPISNGEIIFEPFLAVWLNDMLTEHWGYGTASVERSKVKAAKEVISFFRAGQIRNYFIDLSGAEKYREAAIVYEQSFSGGSMDLQSTRDLFLSRAKVFFDRNGLRMFDIQDKVNSEIPITLCVSQNSESDEICREFDETENKWSGHQTGWFGLDASDLTWASGASCITQLVYHDSLGLKSTELPLVKHGNLSEQRILEIERCAGEMYRGNTGGY